MRTRRQEGKETRAQIKGKEGGGVERKERALKKLMEGGAKERS